MYVSLLNPRTYVFISISVMKKSTKTKYLPKTSGEK